MRYPIFYNIRHDKVDCEKTDNCTFFECSSAIDIALKNKQIIALTLIINYIVEHQNDHAYAFLFRNNFDEILNLQIDINNLLESEIFYH